MSALRETRQPDTDAVPVSRKKVLFMIPNLSVGGAEKVLVNLVNNLDKSRFDVTVMTLFAGGVNEQFLNGDVRLKHCFKKTFRGNSQILKMFSPKALYRRFVKERCDIAVSYLEGVTARILSGCDDDSTRLVSWIHIQQETKEAASYAFKSYEEAKRCYERFDRTVCVSEYVKNDFTRIFDFKGDIRVLYNTNETKEILRLSKEQTDDLPESGFNLCVVGKVARRKGCDRIVKIQKRLIDSGVDVNVIFLGTGADEGLVRELSREYGISGRVRLMGYQTNPYRYVRACDLLVCASLAEGFSTAVTEALIVGTPTVTVDVSGMKEMLGENNEYGIVTENDDDALYEGIRKMLTTEGLLEAYAKKAEERGKAFGTEKTVKAVEDMFLTL